jgi:uncharacterized membrane protein
MRFLSEQDKYLKEVFERDFISTLYMFVVLGIFVIFILFDMKLFLVNQTFLNNTIRAVQGKSVRVRYAGALLCYVALTYLLYTHLSLDYPKTFLLGSSVYAVYEGTNYAIFQNWPASMVLIDTLWGGVLFVAVKYIYSLV